VADILSAHPDVALDTHVQLELGVDPQVPGAAWQAAVMLFRSFSVGAILPLFPWFFAMGSGPAIASIIVGAIAALALGAAIGFMSGRNVLVVVRTGGAAAAVGIPSPTGLSGPSRPSPARSAIRASRLNGTCIRL
jgi:vacuolar iron transporter family protein